MKRLLGCVIVMLLATSLACGLSESGTDTPTPTDAAFVVTPLQATTPPSVATTPPPVVTTPPPDVTTETGCTLNAGYVADVTIPDDTPLAPGTTFRKTWRIRNTGTCAWEAGTRFIYVNGDPLGGPPEIVSPLAAPGASVDVNVDFVAPATPGTYRSNWQLQAPDGTRFGQMFYVQIVVPTPATNTPTPTHTPTATPTSTPGTPTLPPACVVPDAQFTNLVTQAQARGMNVGCAVGSVVSLNGAAQQYWANVTDTNPGTHYRSYMIWRSDTRNIYLIGGNDTTAYSAGGSVYNDSWDESQPDILPACSTLTPPTGYLVPVRGFGKLWCTYSWSNTLGWPDQAESAVTLTVQPVDSGVLMKVVGLPGGTFWVAMDFNSGQATVRLAP